MEDYLEHIEQAKYDYETFDENRRASEEDIMFAMADGGHWDNWSYYIDERFRNRARLQLDFVTQAHNRHMAEWSANRIEAKFSPDDDQTTEDLAEILQGLYRRDKRRSNGQIAVDQAKSAQSLCGIGAWLLHTTYENEEDPEDERQRIAWRPIYSAHNTVIWDCGAKRVDKLDARHVHILEEFETSYLEDEYPDIENFESVFDPGSFRTRMRHVGKESVFLMTRYEKKKERKKVHVYAHPDGQKQFVDSDDVAEVKDDLERMGFTFIRERVIHRQYVEKSVLHGGGYLEKPRKIAGKYLPVVPMYGYHGYADGKEYYYGLVRKKKDPQRLVDMQVSMVAEVAGSRPNTIPVIDPESIEGYEHIWNGDMSKKNWAPKKVILDENGNPISSQMEFLPPPQVDPNTMALMEFTSSYLREQTGGMMDDIKDQEYSGRAIRELIKRQNMIAKPLFDNAGVAMRCEGIVYASMAQDVYGIPRKAKLVNLDGSERVVQLMKRIADEKGGIKVINDLSLGSFEVVVEAGQSYDSMREETVENLRSLLADIQPTSPYYGPAMASYIEVMGGAGLDELKDFNRKQMILQGLKEPENEEDQALIENNGQPNTAEMLQQAAAQQQLAEADYLRAGAIQRTADAEKKTAETQKIFNEIRSDGVKTMIQGNKASIDGLRAAVGL